MNVLERLPRLAALFGHKPVSKEKHVNPIYLKIKLKSLAAEARIIRAQERKTKGQWNALRESLYLHRTKDVRGEARATHVAYGFLRGRPYQCIEPKSYTAPDWERVQAMVKKYGASMLDKLEAWKPKAAETSAVA